MTWWHVLQHWLAIHTGTLNEPGPYYGFWSGFGSDIAEFGIIFGLFAAYRHHNCHVKGCPRLARHEYEMNGVQYKLCRKHHPVVTTKLTHEQFVRYHEEKMNDHSV